MIKRECLYTVLALIGGVLGGFTSSKLTLTAGATSASPPQHVTASQQILLVDAKGQTRAVLGLNRDGDAGLSLYDHQGKVRTVMDISDAEGVGFKVFDTRGALRISLVLSSDQIPALRLFDSQHHARALMGVDPEGEAALDFYSEEGKLLRELP